MLQCCSVTSATFKTPVSRRVRPLMRRAGQVSASSAYSPRCEPRIHPDGSFPRHGHRRAKAARNGRHRGPGHFNDKVASDRGRKEKNVRTVGTQGNDRRRSSRMPHRTRDLRRLWGQRAVPKSRRFFLFPQSVGQFESRTDFCEFPSHRKGSSYGERFFSF